MSPIFNEETPAMTTATSATAAVTNVTDGCLWALTTYFNPMRYRRRLDNYRVFRAALGVPLVTVELAQPNTFDLVEQDADVLIQLRGEPFLWQKERLLNVALPHVPMNVPLIAWLDCDIVFERSSWWTDAALKLRAAPITQLFSELYDLPRDTTVGDTDRYPKVATGTSIARLVATDSSVSEDFRPATNDRVRRGLFGLGWAARRDLLEAHGFYDAMILGSGDRVMACAAYGRFADGIYSTRLGAKRSAHYLKWAYPFFDSVRGNVACVDGRLFHLWHGDLHNRRYVQRHVDLAAFEFDPFTDITIDDSGCWAWKGRKDPLVTFIKTYFASREEDGTMQTETTAQ
jgi:hypothetical protein